MVYDLLVAYVMMAWFVLMIGLFYLIVSDYCVVVGVLLNVVVGPRLLWFGWSDLGCAV